MSRISDTSVRTMLVCLLLGVLTFGTYYPVLQSGFIELDDPQYVTHNPGVLQGLTWRTTEWALLTGHASNWHPLTWLSHQLDVQLFGLQPRWHHLTSLLFHIANSLLLFGWLRQMTVTLWRSALVAALFALHPLHVESVAWVAERKDVLSTFFFMLTIWAYAKYAQSKVGARNKVQNLTSKVGGIGRTRLAYYALALVLFTLGLLSKPMVVTLPFVLLLLDYWPLRRWELETGESNRGNKLSRVITGRTLLLEKLPFLALSAGASFITFLVQDRAHSVSIGVPFEPRFANAIASYLKYLSKTVWPSNLAVFYPHPVLGSVTQDPWAPEVYAAGLVIVGLTCWALFCLKREPWFAVGWFWYLGTLVPVIGIVQVGGQAMADRYTYIPLIGIFIVAVWAAAEFLNRAPRPAGSETGAPISNLGWRRAWPGILGIAVVVACVAAARNQVNYWHDDLSLFEHALAATKHNALAHCNLGGDYAKLGKYEVAEGHYRKALEEAPNFVEAYLGLGAIFDAQGKKDEALEQFQAAVRSRPWNAVARNCLGAMFLHQGRNEEALAEFSEAVRLEPSLCEGQCNLGRALTGLGKLNEALARFNTALECDPKNELTHFFRGHILSKLHQPELALVEYRDVLRLNPTNSAALNDLAWIRAASPDARLRDGAEAVKLAEHACQLTGFREPQIIGTLAAAYAEAGRFDEAIKTGQKAKELASASGSKLLADKNEELLAFYRDRKPYHEPEVPQ